MSENICIRCGGPSSEVSAVCFSCQQLEGLPELRHPDLNVSFPYAPPPPSQGGSQAPGQRSVLEAAFRCPRCQSSKGTYPMEAVSVTGWAVFALALLFCLPLFFLGLMIKETSLYCLSCDMKTGKA